MAGLLRNVVAAKILDALSKYGSGSDIRAAIQWGIRVQPLIKKPNPKTTTVSVKISQKYLKSQGLLPVLERDELTSWGNDVVKEIPFDDVVKNVEFSQGNFTACVDGTWMTKNVLGSVYEEKENYGMTGSLHNYKVINGKLETVKPNQKVLVEFSSPNIAKPFHAGHLRSTVLGNSISRLYRALGHDVTTINYLGDWGTQFGYLVAGFSDHGSEERLLESPMEHMFDVYVKAHKDAENDESFHKRAKDIFSQMEAGCLDSLKFWTRCRELSIAEYKKTYKRLGIDFDSYEGESQYSARCKDLIHELEQRDLLKLHEKTGVRYLDVSDVGNTSNNPEYVNVLKSDGSSLYITRDIAAFSCRKENYNFDRLIYVVDQSQEHHFSQLVLVCRKLGYISPNDLDTVADYHVPFGRVEGMSTRRGDVVFLNDILDEATARMKEIMLSKETTKVHAPEAVDETANILAVSALIVQNLTEHRNKGYKFSWDRVLSFKGNTGPFLQYQHARLCSLLRTVEEELGLVPNVNVDYSVLVEDIDALKLVAHLAKFDEAVMNTYAKLEPHFITHYLSDLCHLSSKAISVLNVKQSPYHIAQARLLLFDCVRQALSNGLQLLGITPLEKM